MFSSLFTNTVLTGFDALFPNVRFPLTWHTPSNFVRFRILSIGLSVSGYESSVSTDAASDIAINAAVFKAPSSTGFDTTSVVTITLRRSLAISRSQEAPTASSHISIPRELCNVGGLEMWRKNAARERIRGEAVNQALPSTNDRPGARSPCEVTSRESLASGFLINPQCLYSMLPLRCEFAVNCGPSRLTLPAHVNRPDYKGVHFDVDLFGAILILIVPFVFKEGTITPLIKGT